MSKPIKSYPRDQRAAVIERRLKEKKGGLGYWSAVDAKKQLRGVIIGYDRCNEVDISVTSYINPQNKQIIFQYCNA